MDRQAVIYTRVSQDQSQGRSVADQERECRDECERKGWPVRDVFCDNDIGASRHSVKQRLAWQKLKAELRPGDILVCWEASRAQRDLEEFVTLRNLCCSLNVPLSYSGRVLDFTIGDDRFTGGMDALIAEREAEQIRERILRGKRQSAAEGRPFGLAPWGYRRVDKGVWEVDPVEGPRVRESVERLLSGQSQRQILAWLKLPGTGADLRRRLVNPTYAGLRVHRGEVVGKGNWPPIITEEQHRAVVALTNRQRRQDGRTAQPGPDPQHLLSGIATCGYPGCGNVLEYGYRQGRPAYRCKPHGHVYRSEADLDVLVADAVVRRVAEIDPADYEHANNTAEADAAQAEIDTIEDELAAFTAKAIASQISAGAFAQIEAGLLARIETLRPKTSTLKLTKQPEWVLFANFHDLPIAQRREIVRAWVTVVVNPVVKGKRATIHDVVITPI